MRKLRRDSGALLVSRSQPEGNELLQLRQQVVFEGA